jgi:anthranilate phosphoribosyltransferase
MNQFLSRVAQGEVLSRDEARMAMDLIMSGEATPAQIAAFVTAIKMRGETVEEIAGFAETMRRKASTVNVSKQNLLDTCGTGGDGGKTFNISTAAAIVAAAAGIRVAKHGNRAVSSQSGSADVLESLGVEIQFSPESAARVLDEVGFSFMFAPMFHQAMKYAAAPRKEMGYRTVFNLLGPLTNPAGADRQIMGVYDRNLTEPIAEVLHSLGTVRAMVVASLDGLDEISISAPTQISELKDGEVRTYTVCPEAIGLQSYPLETVKGGDAAYNAMLIERVFKGEERGSCREIVLANAGAAIYLAGLAGTLKEGVQAAAVVIDDGRALNKLEQLRRVSKETKERVS